MTCSTCNANPARVKGQCLTCDRYERRNGVKRPEHLTNRQPDLNYRRYVDQEERRIIRRFLAAVF